MTGAADGIGRALVLAFAKEGAQVAGCSRSAERLDSLEKEIKGSGHIFFATDLSNAEGISEFFNKTQETFSGVDILVNNVGAVLKLGNFLEVSDQDWENSFQLNLMSAVRLCRLSIPALRKSSCPRIINISSNAASHPQEIFPHYSAMKAALNNLSTHLAKKYAQENISIVSSWNNVNQLEILSAPKTGLQRRIWTARSEEHGKIVVNQKSHLPLKMQ